MIKFLFKFLFNRLTYGQLVELVYSNPVVQSYFRTQQALAEQEAFIAEQEQKVSALELMEPLLPVADVPTPIEVVVRMDTMQYERLEQIVSNTGVVSTTSEIEAGFKLGVQHVLQKLRAGYVIQKG